MTIYNGWEELQFNNELELTEFYGNQNLYSDKILTNQYIIIKNGDKVVDYFKKTVDGELKRLKFPTISNSYNNEIKPKNPQQYCAMDLLKDRTSRVKLLRGVFGSGKDLLMLNEALNLVEKGEFEKIVFIRPNVTVKDVPDIGYLKGSIDDKLDWTLGPIYDKVGGQDGIDRLKFQGQLESQPLLFIRGRSFENCIVYVTEGQNMTTEIVKLLLGRIGHGSELWINGDTRQFDAKVYEKQNGLTAMEKVLAGNKLFGFVYLPITERDEVANLANLFDEYEAELNK